MEDDAKWTRRGVIEGSVAATAAFALADILGPGAASAEPGGRVTASPSGRGDTHRLWYDRPATVWTEALPIGNGRLGAMVFGGVADERLQLNEDSFWSGGPYDPVNPAASAALPEVRRLIAAGRFAEAEALANARVMGTPLHQMAYQTIGDLRLAMPKLAGVKTSAYRRDLDLDVATATTEFTADGVRYRRTVLVSPGDQVIALTLTADRPGAIDCDVALTSPQAAQAKAVGDRIALDGRAPDANGVRGALRFAVLVRVVPQGGTADARDGTVQVRGADSVTLLVAIATHHRAGQGSSGDGEYGSTTAAAALADRQVAAAARRSFAAIAVDTAAAHRALYRRVTLDLPAGPGATLPTDARILVAETTDDPSLAALYFHYGRYLLICASRAGTQPANLQGIWNDSVDPPWGSKYTININTQMNYWPAEPTALGECVEPLVRMVRELAESGARTARAMYGARGWVAHHNTDLWRATAPIDGAAWGLWPMGGAWLCLSLWDRYDYGGDMGYLASVYPLLRGAALFFLDTLVRDPKTGLAMTSPSISPENRHPHGASVCAGPAMDQQILRDLFDRVGKAAALLGIDAAFAGDVRAMRARLAPDQIGAQGQLQEWQADWDAAAPEPHHRHVSHLYALFPSDQINPRDTPALAAAAARSLTLRGDESTGWATAWRANLWARLGDGDHAHRILRFLLGSGRTYPNLFDAHPPFQIDGNFGGTRAIAEMLMQDDGTEIALLPALPGAWPAGRIAGLRMRGGLRLDLDWADGALHRATLVASRPVTRTIRLGARTRRLDLRPGAPVVLSGVALTIASSGDL